MIEDLGYATLDMAVDVCDGGSPLRTPPVWRTSLSGKPPKSSPPTEGRYHDYYLRHRSQSSRLNSTGKNNTRQLYQQHATTFPWHMSIPGVSGGETMNRKKCPHHPDFCIFTD